MRVFVVSSVLPENSGAGAILLYRHLSGSAEIEFEIAASCFAPEKRTNVIHDRLRRTRLAPWINTAEEVIAPRRADRSDIAQARRFKPDVILTVAHGTLYRSAATLARKLNLPLVTFFHDWWPDLPQLTAFGRRLVERDIRKLARDSALCFCVSEGMVRELGNSANAMVLPPIPGVPIPAAKATKSASRFAVSYGGNLFDYGPMIGDLACVLMDMPDIDIKVRGSQPDWPPERLRLLSERGVYLDNAPPAEFEAWMTTFDAFICPMRFEPAQRRRMRTSFPSKLLDLLRFGKPIVVWGPDDCSAVQWVRHTGCAVCVTDPDPMVVAGEIEKLAADRPERERLGAACRQLAAGAFHPSAIQKKFLDGLHAVTRADRAGVEAVS